MDAQIWYGQLRYAVWTVSYSNQIPSGYAQNRIWADSLNEAYELTLWTGKYGCFFSFGLFWFVLFVCFVLEFDRHGHYELSLWTKYSCVFFVLFWSLV